MRKDSRNHSPDALFKARGLRSDPSTSEKIVWKLLRRKRTGFLFRRQTPVGPYVMDFYCAEASLCVEVDGEQHKNRAEGDASRDMYLEARGIKTYRIPTSDIFEDNLVGALGHIEAIARLCRDRTGREPFAEW